MHVVASSSPACPPDRIGLPPARIACSTSRLFASVPVIGESSSQVGVQPRPSTKAAVNAESPWWRIALSRLWVCTLVGSKYGATTGTGRLSAPGAAPALGSAPAVAAALSTRTAATPQASAGAQRRGAVRRGGTSRVIDHVYPRRPDAARDSPAPGAAAQAYEGV